VLCLSRQLSKLNFFQDENSGQLNGVFSAIVDNTGGVKYSL
jgi:hypothetical protein